MSFDALVPVILFGGIDMGAIFADPPTHPSPLTAAQMMNQKITRGNVQSVW
jgi:hypothetical protein